MSEVNNLLLLQKDHSIKLIGFNKLSQNITFHLFNGGVSICNTKNKKNESENIINVSLDDEKFIVHNLLYDKLCERNYSPIEEFIFIDNCYYESNLHPLNPSK